MILGAIKGLKTPKSKVNFEKHQKTKGTHEHLLEQKKSLTCPFITSGLCWAREAMSSSPSTSFSQTALCSRLTARVNPSPGPLGNVRTFNYTNSKLLDHKVHIYLEYTVSVPSLELCPSPPHTLSPSPASEYAPPPEPKGEAHLPPCKGVGESQFGRLERKLSILSTLCSVLLTVGDMK